ncbi:acyl-CoA dehydrogenase family protein [Priestia megaterium]|uniref:acyl-CoA dehydrogenase family protein n=1 Tax=Priestia megaterium TaxID=1404 RepID=UPI0012D8F594|nr:acyl-CoA dehydrogenase family protein [Priestia megaterium]MUL34444.1 Acyl-CoA dehydrogenase [Priestia megaterium]
MQYSIEHEQFRYEIKKIISSYIEPKIQEWEENESVPRELFKILGDHNLLGLTVPIEDGGRGLDISYTLILVQELMRINAVGVASSILIQLNTVSPLLSRFGNDYIKRKFLHPIIKGESIGALAVTEPSGGSDLLRAVQCTAIKKNEHWLLNGEKKFITNSPIADKLVVLAKTKDSHSPLSMSLFAIDASGEGYKVNQLFKMSQKASPIGHIVFDNYQIPLNNVVGKLNNGYMMSMDVLYEERFLIGSAAISLAEETLKKTIDYLKHRYYKGEPITNYQSIRYELSEFFAEIEACKSMIRQVCHSIIIGKIDKARATMIKFHFCDLGQLIVQRCHQLFGSFGLYENSWIDRAVRDIRIFSIYAGSSETMKDFSSFKLIPNLYK